jgi:hypothetical protein
MRKRNLLSALLFCLAFISLNAQSGGNENGHGQPPQIPIEILLKGGSTDDPQGLTGNTLIPVSASYTSDTLFIDVEEYSGVMVVAVVNTFTNQAVLQTLEHVSVNNSSVEIGISSLSHGSYRVDIYLANDEEYEGFFEIE